MAKNTDPAIKTHAHESSATSKRSTQRCQYCDEPFQPRRASQRFCSNEHRRLYYDALKHTCPVCGYVHIPLLNKVDANNQQPEDTAGDNP